MTPARQPVPELPENYWHCPFRKGCEVGESYCDWPCDKWATWHDDNIRKAERERVLDELVKKVDAGMPSVSADRFRAGLKTAYGNVYLWIESLRQQEERR